MTVVEPARVHPGGSLSLLVYDHDAQVLRPASVGSDGSVMVECELNEEEQEHLFMGGRVRVWLQLPPEVLKNALSMTVEATVPQE